MIIMVFLGVLVVVDIVVLKNSGLVLWSKQSHGESNSNSKQNQHIVVLHVAYFF